jgi:hypothetical protein
MGTNAGCTMPLLPSRIWKKGGIISPLLSQSTDRFNRSKMSLQSRTSTMAEWPKFKVSQSVTKGDNAKDHVKEVEVLVRGVERNKVTTITKFVSRMINDASSSIYEELYAVKVGDSIKIVFKFIKSLDANEEENDTSMVEESWGEASTQGKKLEGEISIVCIHEHPYLEKKVWLETNTHVETIYLKGK